MRLPQALHLDALLGAMSWVAEVRMEAVASGSSNRVSLSSADQPKLNPVTSRNLDSRVDRPCTESVRAIVMGLGKQMKFVPYRSLASDGRMIPAPSLSGLQALLFSFGRQLSQRCPIPASAQGARYTRFS